MEQLCTQVGHERQSIFKCPSDKKTLCILCLKEIHGDCRNQFLNAQQFIDKISQIKFKTQLAEEHSIIYLLTELKMKSQSFIEILKVFANNVITNYGKDSRINRIDKILEHQKLLQTDDWNEGFKLLTNQLPIFQQSTYNLKQSLTQLQKLIETISQIQVQGKLDKLDPNRGNDNTMHLSLEVATKDETTLIQTQQLSNHQASCLTTNDPRNLIIKQQKQDVTVKQTTQQIGSIELKQENCQNIQNSGYSPITDYKPSIIEAKHSIATIALSPNGKYVASAGGDGDYQIKIWDLITGKQIGNGMSGHKDWINSINYSKCGKYIVSGSDDRTIRQWKANTQKQIGTPMCGHENIIYGVQYTSDQNQIISCSWDQTLRIWNSDTGKEYLDKRIYHESKVCCMALSPILKEVAFGDWKGIITIYHYEYNLKIESLKGHTECIKSLNYSNDGGYIVSGGDDKVIHLWNAISKQLIISLTGHSQSIESVSFSTDMKYIISGGPDTTVRIWNTLAGRQVGEPLTYHTDFIRSTQFSIDGNYIITGGRDKNLSIMPVIKEQLKKIQQIDVVEKSLNLSNKIQAKIDHNLVFIGQSQNMHLNKSAQFDCKQQMYNLALNQLSTTNQVSLEQCYYEKSYIDRHRSLNQYNCTIALTANIQHVRVLIRIGFSHQISIWNPNTLEQIGQSMYDHEDQIAQINYSNCGNYIVSGSFDKTIRQWYVYTQKQIGQPIYGHEDYITGVQYTPDQRYIISSSWDRTIRLWHRETGKEQLDKRIENQNWIYCLSISPISNKVAFGDSQGIIKICEYEKHELSQVLQGHKSGVRSLQFSTNGLYIVSGGDDKAILIWNAISGEYIASLIGHYESILSVNFSPDMKYIISGASDNTARLWDPVTGEQIGQSLVKIRGKVSSTQFSIDGKYIVVGGESQQLKIMKAPIKKDQQSEHNCGLF